MSRKTMYTLFAAFILAAMMLTACGGGGAATDETIKVGAIHDLTGPTSDVGTPLCRRNQGLCCLAQCQWRY
ncbi:MAG: hypothetical protein HN855_10935 [Anaerolineae bacterium]|nr:hypothetical protein [Anaerolineae bacterium]MBT7325666.1 hypothetical protein [Anaerolineae bacterium]